MPDELSKRNNKGIKYRFLLRNSYIRFFIIGLSIFIVLNIFAYIFALLLLNPQTITVLKNTRTLPQSNEELEKAKTETEFTDLLKKDCRPINMGDWYSGRISINRLPINISQSFKKNIISENNEIGCSKESILLTYKNPYNVTNYFSEYSSNNLEVFNEKNVSSTYYFNNFPVLIKNDGDVAIYAELGSSGDGGFYTTRLYVYGEKKITLPNKEVLTIRIREPFGIVASENDPLEKSFPNEEITKMIVLGLYQQLPLSTLLDINRILYMENLLKEISPK